MYVVCRIFEKSGAGPKNGAKYGAPLDEKEWDVDEENEQKEVVPVPATAHRVVAPLTEISPNVVAPPLPATAAVAPPVVATGGDFWDDIGAFLETNDLDGVCIHRVVFVSQLIGLICEEIVYIYMAWDKFLFFL